MTKAVHAGPQLINIVVLISKICETDDLEMLHKFRVNRVVNLSHHRLSQEHQDLLSLD